MLVSSLLCRCSQWTRFVDLGRYCRRWAYRVYYCDLLVLWEPSSIKACGTVVSMANLIRRPTKQAPLRLRAMFALTNERPLTSRTHG